MSTYDSNGFEFHNDLVLATAVRLIKEKGSTTTLDIKEELRKRHEVVDLGFVTFKSSFTQQQVSESMDWLANNSYFSYTYNGTYRTYYLNTVEFNDKTDDKEEEDIEDLHVSVSEALDVINDLMVGENIIITFIKKDSTKRTINAQIDCPNKGDGFIKVVDKDIPKDKDNINIRTIDLRRLLSFEYDNVNYIIDKSIK